jgi:hypothetical protein
MSIIAYLEIILLYFKLQRKFQIKFFSITHVSYYCLFQRNDFVLFSFVLHFHLTQNLWSFEIYCKFETIQIYAILFASKTIYEFKIEKEKICLKKKETGRGGPNRLERRSRSSPLRTPARSGTMPATPRH